MPRYRNELGVLLDIPEDKAARINGLTPVDPAPASRKSPRKSTGRDPNAQESNDK